MSDPRVAKLAKVLVDYSIPVQAGDWFVIRATDLAALLVREVYRAALLAGALYIDTRIGVDGLAEVMFKHGTDEQLAHVSEFERLTTDKVNSTLNIIAPHNLKALSGVDPKRQALASKARAELSKIFMQRSATRDLRWCVTLYPTNASAQEAGMSLGDYEQFVYGAMLLDNDDPIEAWQAQGREQQRIADFLSETRELRIVGKDTDLRLGIAGRKWENADGRMNFPDGEVFSAPIEDSVNGVVTYTYPAIYGGREVDGVRLTFENGRVVDARASKGEDFLNEMLNMDAGARVLGELGIGTNYGIQRFSKNMLFDEKIGGTAHLALGAGYPETGSSNESSLHWDMLVDLRDGGEIFADGRSVMKNGRWMLEDGR